MAASAGQLRNRMLNGAVTNCVKVAVRFLKTIILTRILFFHFGEDYYGFWMLLWSVFGYVLLFELGFGKTVQKYAAEALAGGGMRRLNQVVQLVFGSYLAIALIIAVLSGVGAWLLPEWTKLPDGADVNYYRISFLAFGLGCAVVFPSGIIPEILAGLSRLHYRNWVIVGNQLLELLGLWLIFRLGGSLLSAALFVSCNNLVSNLVMALAVRRILPELSLRPSRIRWRLVREISGFSGFIYLMAVAKLVLFKAAPVILGAMRGLGAVAEFQLGTRVPEMIRLMTGQFQETLGPAAALCRKQNREDDLRRLMLYCQRASLFLAVGALAVVLPLAPAIMKVWLHLESDLVNRIAFWTLVHFAVLAAWRDGSREILLMTGYHRLLAWVAVGECLISLGLTIALVCRMGVEGAVWGMLLPNLVIAFGIFLPVTVRYLNMGWGGYLIRVCGGSLLAGIVPGAVLWYWAAAWPTAEWSFFWLVLAGVLGGGCYAAGGVLFCLEREEKRRILELARKRLMGKNQDRATAQ